MNQLESWVRLNLIMIKNKAVFFDRDGVLNEERKDYVKSISELKIFPYIGNAIKKLQSSGFLTIVITNQSAINRGLTSTENINAIHLTIQDFLKDFETKISHFYRTIQKHFYRTIQKKIMIFCTKIMIFCTAPKKKMKYIFLVFIV